MSRDVTQTGEGVLSQSPPVGRTPGWVLMCVSHKIGGAVIRLGVDIAGLPCASDCMQPILPTQFIRLQTKTFKATL